MQGVEFASSSRLRMFNLIEWIVLVWGAYSQQITRKPRSFPWRKMMLLMVVQNVFSGHYLTHYFCVKSERTQYRGVLCYGWREQNAPD